MQRSAWLATIFICMALAAVSPLNAQDPAPSAPQTPPPTRGGNEATRSELEALLRQDGESMSSADRAAIERRLREGDIKPGDRVVVAVFGESALADTFVVRTGQVLALPNLADISLKGVLRSEVQDRLTKEISRYIKEPDVEAIALVNVGVFGAVGRPGFYSYPADMLVSDAVMSAGGFTPKADPRRTRIRRNGIVIGEHEDVQAALDRGLSLDQLNLQSNDEFVVGEKGSGFLGVIQTAALVSGILLGIAAVGRLF